MATTQNDQGPQEIVQHLHAYVDRAVALNGGSTRARRPNHRVKFVWPPHPVSYSYHVLSTDWKGSASFEAYGESFPVQVANTPFGVFGRCPSIWHEERGETEEEMLQRLRVTSQPLFDRQLAINVALERPGRFTGSIQELGRCDLVKLLYCSDRDVANDASIEIEVHASDRIFFPALVSIIADRRHPLRRSAQWCVLDLFEDLPSFCQNAQDEASAIMAMKGLIWDAEDDYARTIYKAGVVLGGHIPHAHGGPTLIECLEAPSRIGRRAAIHGLFHVVEWMPEMRDTVVSELQKSAKNDPDEVLRNYAAMMADDIANSDTDHTPDPMFPEED